MSLEIYKASAGSGKTFQIVRQYLKMAFKRPGAYRNILGVTFTNKATAEMKDRILWELARLSEGQPSPHRSFLEEQLNLNGTEVNLTAAKILKLILHDYSRFSISTIDSLFQRVIRSFSREMHLNPSYRTEIDNKGILEEAVNQLFLDIDHNEELRNWMLAYTQENLQNGKRWNLTEELIKRGADLFKEDFKQFSASLLDKIADKNFLVDYNTELKSNVEFYEKTLKDFGQQGIQLLEKYELTTDQFKYGKTSFANHFNKLSNGVFELSKRALDACNNLQSWYKSTDNKAVINKIVEVYDAGLNDVLVRSIEFLQQETVKANTAKVILSNLFSFGLLTDIALKVNEVSREKNLILLNDSTSLLQKVINRNDAPFVYEKMGSVYRHYFLDEFQDTSNLQWQNLKPLVENSLAEGHANVVVGDVKQSIYRWRNGDWNLLASQLGHDFSKFEIRETPLDTNWRSSKNIIDFNNIIFKQASRYLNDDFENALNDPDETGEMKGIIEKLYKEHYQNCPNKTSKEGYIRIKFIEREQGQRIKEYRQSVLTELILQIEQVQEKGIRPKDIAVLVRSKSEGALVADALLQRRMGKPESPCSYDFISNDTLLIGQSPVVQFLLNLFTLMNNPENNIVRAGLFYSYRNILFPLRANEAASLHTSFDIHQNLPDQFKKWIPGDEGIPDPDLMSLPLYSLAAKMVAEFDLGKIEREQIYLDAFLNLILEYSREEAGGIAHFLDWWKLIGKDKTISLPEGQDAITIMTIHKAKGLEFRTVFIPFCDWETEPCSTKAPYLWCRPQEEPFNKLDLVLVKYGKSLEQSWFAGDYYREMLYSMVDNLNLLYVAFTRAVNGLFIICPYSSKLNDKSKEVGSLLQRIVENPPLLDSIDREKYIDLAEYWNPESKTFEMGVLQKVLYPEKQQSATHKSSAFRISSQKDRFRIRLHSQEYPDLFEKKTSEPIQFGRLLHKIFENIGTSSDIDRSIRQMVSEGKIDSATAREYEVIIRKMLSAEPFNSWFNGEWRILNERTILRGKDSSHRPDRMMIKDHQVVLVDYKTGEKHDSHHSQIKGYIRDLKKIGYLEVKGYLWYLNTNELDEVIPDSVENLIMI